MTRLPTFFIVAAVGGATLAFALQQGVAQQAVDPSDPNTVQQQERPATDADRSAPQRREAFRNPGALPQAGNLDDQTRGANVRASQLIGMNIQNPQGEDIGEINDLVIDGQTGKVRYAAVAYGGFLGIGDKLFAVPFEKFQTQVDPDDRDEYVLVLDVTEQQLEGAQGFDQENWPNFADQNFTDAVDQRYGVERNAAEQDGGVDVETGEREIRSP